MLTAATTFKLRANSYKKDKKINKRAEILKNIAKVA
jgi:hypothetical protein